MVSVPKSSSFTAPAPRSRFIWIAIAKWSALSLLLVAAALFVDFARVGRDLRSLSFTSLLAFLALGVLGRLGCSARWHVVCANLLHMTGTSPFRLLRVNLLADFVSVVVPSQVGGEAVRIVKVAQSTGTKGNAAFSVFLDRLTGLATAVLMAACLLPWLGGPPGSADWPLVRMLVSAGLAVAVAGGGWLVLRRRRLSQPWMGGLPVRSRAWVAICLLSVAGQGVLGSSYYCLFSEVATLPFLTVLSVVTTAQLARSVPVSLLGLSLAEPSLVALAGMAGADVHGVAVVVVVSVASRYLFGAAGLVVEVLCDGSQFTAGLFGRKGIILEDCR